MGVTITMPLFGNPGHELEEGARVKGQQLRELAEALDERLRQAAETLDRLGADGWSAHVAMFELFLSHPEVHTQEQAEVRLRASGVDPTQMMILEDLDEEELDQDE